MDSFVLKPCPFCDSDDVELVEHPDMSHGVVCRCCGVRGPVHIKTFYQREKASLASAVLLWNDRPDPRVPEVEIILDTDTESNDNHPLKQTGPSARPVVALTSSSGSGDELELRPETVEKEEHRFEIPTNPREALAFFQVTIAAWMREHSLTHEKAAKKLKIAKADLLKVLQLKPPTRDVLQALMVQIPNLKGMSNG